MKYYDLADDVHIPSRWYLGDVRLADGAEVELISGKRLSLLARPNLDMTTKGRPLDFSLTSFAAPIATAKLARAIAEVAGADVELIPLRIGERDGYFALNATRLVACVDESRSVIMKWTAQDHRADLAGQYRMVGNLHIDATAVPADAHFFRIKGYPVILIVSEIVKVAMEQAGCLGAKFLDVM
jgi:hypothetical protein